MKPNKRTTAKHVVKPMLAVSAFDESKPCYCNLCERTYKNYKRFKIHMKKHYC